MCPRSSPADNLRNDRFHHFRIYGSMGLTYFSALIDSSVIVASAVAVYPPYTVVRAFVAVHASEYFYIQTNISHCRPSNKCLNLPVEPSSTRQSCGWCIPARLRVRRPGGISRKTKKLLPARLVLESERVWPSTHSNECIYSLPLADYQQLCFLCIVVRTKKLPMRTRNASSITVKTRPIERSLRAWHRRLPSTNPIEIMRALSF